jgi:hypothetical protein
VISEAGWVLQTIDRCVRVKLGSLVPFLSDLPP